MAFDALDAQLRQLQGDIVAKSNQGLMYGGTTKSEYDFLAKAAMDDTKGPNFYSFMAGISAGNLAQQEAQQQQYDRAQGLRDLNSQLIYRDAQARNVNAQAAGQEATNPYIPDVQRSNIGQTRANTESTLANAQGQQNINPYLAAGQQADNSYKAAMASNTVANAAGQFNINPYLAAGQQADNSYKAAMASNTVANAVGQFNINPHLAETQKAIIADKQTSGYGGLTAQQAQALAAQQKAQAPVPATGTPPPATTAAQPAPQLAPALTPQVVSTLQGVYGKLTDPTYQPSAAEIAALDVWRAAGKPVLPGAAP